MTAVLLRLRDLLRRFLRWWLGELAGLVPERLRRRLAAAAERLVLCPGTDATGPYLAVYLENGTGHRPLGRVDLGEAPEARLATLLRRAGLAGGVAAGRLKICVRLDPDQALRTSFELPLAAAANLAEVVSYELDRHTPFNAEQVRFACRLVARDPAAERLTVAVTLVPRPIADHAVAQARRLGLEPDRLDVAAESGAGPPSGNLLPSATAAMRRRLGPLTYGLAAAAALLALVALFLPLFRAQQEAAALTRQFALVKRSADTSGVLERQLAALDRDERFLTDKKRERPPVSALVDETTRILPDDTWLTEWTLAQGEVQMRGLTRSAATVVGAVEQSKIFHGTTFRSPVMQESDSGRERFHISAQVAGVSAQVAGGAAP